MSSYDSCVCPGQQALPVPRGNVDLLRRTGSGIPVQRLANVHICVPDHRAYNMRGTRETGPPAFR